MTNFRLQNRINMQCYDRIRLGHWGDGGWDMCLAGIYKPKMTDCLVYSFGYVNGAYYVQITLTMYVLYFV